MNDDLRRWLDGELASDALGGGARAEAEAWARMLDAFRVQHPSAAAPPWLEQRVMAEIEALPTPGALRRGVEWLLRPRPVRVSPLAAALVAAGVTVVALLPLARPAGSDRAGPDVAGTEVGPRAEVVLVEFRVEAPGARSVALAGDFTGWSPEHQLEDLNGDGVWTGRVAVPPGVHTYMFVIDGSEWVTDPDAERYLDDGFGNRNAVLAVATPSA